MRPIFKCLLAAALSFECLLGAKAEEAAQNDLVIIACRVDDLTGQPGRHDPNLAARGWRDLELHIVDGEAQCQRVVIRSIVDKSQFDDGATANMIPLEPNLSKPAQCVRLGVMQAKAWDDANPGWATVAIGCPTPIMSSGPDGIEGNADDYQIGLKLPECPVYMPGYYDPERPENNRLRCRFDASAV